MNPTLVNERAAYRGLISAIIKQALDDLRNEKEHIEARVWLKGKNCQSLCSLINFNHRLIQKPRRMGKMLKGD
jgi:hypothetical protein